MNSSPAGASQRQSATERLLALFEANRGREIPLTRILSLGIAQYNARILELRAAGHLIDNRTEWEGSVKHSWFLYRGRRSESRN